MTKWEEKRLGDLVEINPETLSLSKYNGNIQYIDISSVKEGTLDKYTNYSIFDAPGRARRIIKPNDIIFSTVRPNLKAYYYVKQCPENAICSTGFAVLRAKSIANSRFVYSLITEQSFINYLSLVAKGSAYPAVDTNDFKKAKISIPPLPIQEKIADILSTYDDLIENNNRRIALLEKSAQDLYTEWFVRFRFPGHEKAKFEGGLPVGWSVKRLGQIVDITSSKRVYLSDYVESGIPFYRSKEIIQLSEGQSILEPLYISEKAYNNFNNKFGSPQKNDILITSVGTIGKSYLSDGHVFYFKDGNLTWLKTSACPKLAILIYSWLNTDFGKQVLMSSTIGTSQSALTIENLKKIKLIIPNDKILFDFFKIVTSIKDSKSLLSKTNQNLKKQRDLLLPRLMSGQLEV